MSLKTNIEFCRRNLQTKITYRLYEGDLESGSVFPFALFIFYINKTTTHRMLKEAVGPSTSSCKTFLTCFIELGKARVGDNGDVRSPLSRMESDIGFSEL